MTKPSTPSSLFRESGVRLKAMHSGSPPRGVRHDGKDQHDSFETGSAFRLPQSPVMPHAAFLIGAADDRRLFSIR
jgi:hypothetical protein